LAKGPTINVLATIIIGPINMVDDAITKPSYASSAIIGGIKKLARISDFGHVFGQGPHVLIHSRNLSANLK
jgi:hypothetical protein